MFCSNFATLVSLVHGNPILSPEMQEMAKMEGLAEFCQIRYMWPSRHFAKSAVARARISEHVSVSRDSNIFSHTFFVPNQ